ncbi:hypothetical protein [Streptomyces sp. NPDC002156]
MGQRPNLPEEFRSEARIAFAFLVETEGFAEPEDDDLGLRYCRVDLEVRASVAIWDDLSPACGRA